MSKLLKYAKNSKVSVIRIKVDDEDITFMLAKEARIDEHNLIKELKNQPSLYSFLTTLNNKVIKLYEDQEIKVSQTYAERFLDYKTNEEDDYYKSNGKPSDKVAEHLVKKDQLYIRECLKLNKFKRNMNDIWSSVRTFEQRKDVIQTISANIRKEQH